MGSKPNEKAILSSGLANISLIAEGIDSTIDQHLSELRKLLRAKESDLPSISKIIQDIDNYFLLIESDKEDLLKNCIDQLQGIMLDSADLDIDEQLDLQIKSFNKSLLDHENGLLVLPEWLTQVRKIQAKLIQANKSAESINPEDSQEICFALSSGMLNLLGVVSVADDKKVLIESLKRRLESSIAISELEQILEQLAQIITLALSSEQAEFEKYLEKVNGKLAKINKLIDNTREAQQEHYQQSTELDKDVRQHLERLNLSDDNKKNAIEEQLNKILESMDLFQSSSSQYDKKLNKQLVELQSQLTKLEEENQRIRQELLLQHKNSITDSLTQLPNRQAYQERLNHEWAHLERYQTPLCIAIADVDLFKKVNDTYGHQVGDKVLQIIARQVRKNLRQTDFVARYGGEEFVILLPQTQLDQAYQALEMVRNNVAKSPFHYKNQPVNITISFGICECKKGMQPMECFEKADAALYKAKKEGRNQVVVSR